MASSGELRARVDVFGTRWPPPHVRTVNEYPITLAPGSDTRVAEFESMTICVTASFR